MDQISFSLVDNLILSSLGMRILQETVSSEEWKRKKDEPSSGHPEGEKKS